MNKRLLGITLRDLAGIGPEIIIKVLNSNVFYKECRPIVIGALKVLAPVY